VGRIKGGTVQSGVLGDACGGRVSVKPQEAGPWHSSASARVVTRALPRLLGVGWGVLQLGP
jgi:hypothetical protein